MNDEPKAYRMVSLRVGIDCYFLGPLGRGEVEVKGVFTADGLEGEIRYGQLPRYAVPLTPELREHHTHELIDFARRAGVVV